MSKEMTEIEQTHQGSGDNVGNDKNVNNHNHVTTGVNNLHSEKTEVTITQYINQELQKKKRFFKLTIEEDGISPEEAQQYLQIILDAVKKRKGSEKCSITLQFIAEGSTQFILDGDIEDLQILADLQAEGKLEELLNQLKSDDMPKIKVKKAEFIEDKKVIQKAKPIRDIQEGKADKQNLIAEFIEDKKVIQKAELIRDIQEGKADKQNLIEANLIRANLISANLNEANLSGANLNEANLSGANLNEANLIRANLRGANLRGANLRGANFSWVDLSEADLSGANFRGANLSRANFRGANFRGANFRGANFRGANLRGADLSEAYLRGADLSEAYLYDANLSEAYLSE